MPDNALSDSQKSNYLALAKWFGTCQILLVKHRIIIDSVCDARKRECELEITLPGMKNYFSTFSFTFLFLWISIGLAFLCFGSCWFWSTTKTFSECDVTKNLLELRRKSNFPLSFDTTDKALFIEVVVRAGVAPFFAFFAAAESRKINIIKLIFRILRKGFFWVEKAVLNPPHELNIIRIKADVD